MAYFAEETLQAVREIPLYEIVSRSIELKSVGRNWRGLSPFTDEKTPSFYVLTERNYFKCHSSGLAGDGIGFVQKTENLGFAEAVELLAGRFNIEIKYSGGRGPSQEERSRRQQLLDVHAYATEFFRDCFLAQTAEAESVRQYWLEGRGFSEAVAESFNIGYAPPDSSLLIRYLQKRGFADALLAESGMFVNTREGMPPERWFGLFRGRLMIPIRDPQGEVVAFTARQLEQTPRDHDSWKSKYINSLESPVFKKSRLLFNLDRARSSIREQGRVILVEGQLDAIRCASCGLPETVAPQGTSITREQVALLRRSTEKLLAFFDSDAAGIRAVQRLLPMAFAEELAVEVVPCPDKLDPDSLLAAQGKEGFEQLVPESGLAFVARHLKAQTDATPEGEGKLFRELLELIKACPSEVVREGHLEHIAQLTGRSFRAVVEDYQRRGPAPRAGEAQREQPRQENQEKSGTQATGPLTNAESDLLWAVLKNVEWANTLAEVIDHQWIRSNTTTGKVLSRILAEAANDPLISNHNVLNLFENDAELDVVAQFKTWDDAEMDEDFVVNHALKILVQKFCEREISELKRRLNQPSNQPLTNTESLSCITQIRDLNQTRVNGPFPEAHIA
jgi:DNA primase